MTKKSRADAEPIEIFSSEGEEYQLPCNQRPRKLHKSSHPFCPDLYRKACKCKKDSPYCLTGIIPTPGGFRKKGLWQKDAKALLSQGPDPAQELREV